MNKLLAILLLAFTCSLFVSAPEAEAGPVRAHKFHKQHRHHANHRHHHKASFKR